MILGDFNALSTVEDRIGSTVRLGEIGPMSDCITECDLMDVNVNSLLQKVE